MKIFELYCKIGGKTFYQGSINKDSFWSDHYVFWGWYHLSVIMFFFLAGFNHGLLSLFGLTIEIPKPSFYPTGINFVDGFIDLIPETFIPLIFNYFVFIHKKKYLVYMEKYKNVDKKIGGYYVLVLGGLGLIFFYLKIYFTRHPIAALLQTFILS